MVANEFARWSWMGICWIGYYVIMLESGRRFGWEDEVNKESKESKMDKGVSGNLVNITKH